MTMGKKLQHLFNICSTSILNVHRKTAEQVRRVRKACICCFCNLDIITELPTKHISLFNNNNQSLLGDKEILPLRRSIHSVARN